MCTIQKVLKSVEHCPLTCQCPSPQAISVTSLLEIPPGMFCDTVYTLQFGLVCGVGHEPWGLTTSPAHSTRHPSLRVKKHHRPGGVTVERSPANVCSSTVHTARPGPSLWLPLCTARELGLEA